MFDQRNHLDRIRRLRKPSACERNRELVLKLAADMCSLSEIGRLVGTTKTRVREFLDRNGVVRDYPYGYKGEKSPNWKGGRQVTHEGYVKLRLPDHPGNVCGYVLEHRLVMEQMIGRYLVRGEVVHHRNGKRDDNRPENLQLFSENSEHLAFELKGKCPKWTPEGHARIQAGVTRWRESRHEQNRLKSKLGDASSQ